MPLQCCCEIVPPPQAAAPPGLFPILLGHVSTSFVLPFVLQTVKRWAWYWKEGGSVRTGRSVTCENADPFLLSAGSAFLRDEHILVPRFPRWGHSCQHDPWTSCSGIWICYWKRAKPRTHTHTAVGDELCLLCEHLILQQFQKKVIPDVLLVSAQGLWF